MNLSKQQKSVVDFIPTLPSGDIMYTDGEGGTGKSATHDIGFEGMGNVLRTSSSGIAAANIGGRTFHKTFQLHGGFYFDRDAWGVRKAKLAKELGSYKEAGKEQMKQMCKHRVNILATASYLYIDEFPTLRCDLLDEADIRLRHARKEPHLPFGGLRVVASGDLGQLQPVVSKHDELRLEAQGYKAPFGPFESRIMQEIKVHHFHLTHLYRQDDPVFGAMLSRVRTASHTDIDIEWMNSRVREEPPAGATVLSMKRAPAIKINSQKLKQLKGDEITLNAIRTGSYREDKFGRKTPGIYPDVIKLKPYCRVIIKKNDKCKVDGCEVEYRNGQSGVYYGLDKHDRLIVELDCGQTVYVKRDTVGDIDKKVIEEIEVQVDELGMEHNVPVKKLVDNKKGAFRQYPVTLGYAQTGHSSQGLTLDKVHVLLEDERPFCPNWMYVVMSRVRTPEGLTFSRKITKEDIWCIPGLTNNGNQQHSLL
jgi:hypothetical protein